MRVRRLVLAHPVSSSVLGVTLIGAVAMALYWFQPQKLLIDQRVNEALPSAAPETRERSAETSAADASAGDILSSGEFRPLAHSASGKALLIELADGSSHVRLEDFEVENGPDLRVYLSEAPSSAGDDVFDDDFVDLGALKGNIGSQNYQLPADLDLSRYSSVVIWCRRFSVGFAVAPLR